MTVVGITRNAFLVYIFLAVWSLLATPLLMSPVYDFCGISGFDPGVLPWKAGALSA
jgi:hypothetical protein